MEVCLWLLCISRSAGVCVTLVADCTRFILLAKNATDMLQVVGKGLSALTEAQLDMPLDKSLQCSSWGSRPLTQAQVITFVPIIRLQLAE